MLKSLFHRSPRVLHVTQFCRLVMRRYGESLQRRSIAVPRMLNRRFDAIALAWLAVFSLACLPKVLMPATPVHGIIDLLQIVLPYLAIALAPIAGYRLAVASFPPGILFAQPEYRLSFYGRWRQLSVLDAKTSPVFGPTGFMASLLIGLLLNVGVRSFEFLAAMPAINHHGPAWSQTLFLLMAADVVAMGFLYMVCFVMALRSVPYFPRMLLLAWGLDILAQLAIAQTVGDMAGLPASVAQTLAALLEGNIAKVLISAFVWLPYLILSERVNITYRQRIRA